MTEQELLNALDQNTRAAYLELRRRFVDGDYNEYLYLMVEVADEYSVEFDDLQKTATQISALRRSQNKPRPDSYPSDGPTPKEIRAQLGLNAKEVFVYLKALEHQADDMDERMDSGIYSMRLIERWFANPDEPVDVAKIRQLVAAKLVEKKPRAKVIPVSTAWGSDDED